MAILATATPIERPHPTEAIPEPVSSLQPPHGNPLPGQSIPQPEEPEAREVSEDAAALERRAQMVETGRVQLCALVCHGGDKGNFSCTSDKSCGKGGKCEMMCD
jgi:hypothetical protein